MEKTIREASGGIAEEYRKMEVGETVAFPLAQYNYNSVRSASGTTLVPEKLKGWRWSCHIDYGRKCVFVTRTS